MTEPHDPELHELSLPRPARGSIFYSREGPSGGPQVLCVHGVPGSTRDFRYLGPRLAERGFEVFRIDMPGFGRTPRDLWPEHGTRARAALIALVARELGLDRPILAGHSIGCPPCLMAASWYPDRIGGLLLINTPGVERHRGLRVPEGVTGLMGKLLEVPVIGDRIHEVALDGYRRSGFRQEDVDAMDKEVLRQHTEIVGGLDFHALRGAARRVRCPVLIASSANDPLIQPAIAHGLVDALHARVQHLHYAEGGHYLQKHQARDLAAHAARLFTRRRDRWVYGTVSGTGV
jgi:pimeloyl-ACP methyl ester carboxylesterase